MPFSAAAGCSASSQSGDTPATWPRPDPDPDGADRFSGYSLVAVAIGVALLYRNGTE